MTSIASIRLLSRQLANQIAAGEVVERPASILKELLENSLDADAHTIDIDVEQGGIKRIVIRDDGFGIAADELALAVSRHATSKIHSLQDLQAIASMGFRGEALASIASVSHLQLTSRQADSEQAWQLQISDADQRPSEPVPAAHPVGTTVETRDLFYNIPARRKFLRSKRTEYRHIEDVVRRVALSRFDVVLRFRHNQREVFHLPLAADRAAQERRLARLCGKVFVQQAQHIEAVSNDSPRLQLSGWALPPQAARSQADLQYFFVNGRIIRDRLVNHALRQAYADRIYPGRHPGWVLYLQLDPQQLDVNVHPTKHEVRFREARQVHDFLAHSLSQLFASAEFSSTQEQPRAPLAWVNPAEGNASVDARSPAYVRNRQNLSGAALQESVVGYERLRSLAAAPRSVSSSGELKRLAMIDDYLLAQAEQSLILINFPVARRWRLTQQLQGYLDEGAVSQPLLFPLQFELDQVQMQGLQQQADVLAGLGFEWAQPTSESLQLRGAPAALRQLDFQQLLPALLLALADKRVDPLTECASQAVALMPTVSELEADQLLAALWAQRDELAAGIWRELDADELSKLIDDG